MNILFRCIALSPLLAIAACDPASPPSPNGGQTPSAPADNQALIMNQVPDNAENAARFATPELTPQAERTETGARNILLSFARAVEEKQFEAARALLSPADQRKWDSRAFAAIFADLGEITVAVPSGTMTDEPEASEYRAPVTITSTDRDGRPVRIEGVARLRRDKAPATADALTRWRFESLTLDWTH